MAQLPYTAAPEKDPSEGLPDDYQHMRADAGSFGGAIAHGEEAAGKGLEQASGNFFEAAKYYDTLAADDQFNKADVLARNLRRGDPSKMVRGPDGKPVPDTGYMGLQGKDALDQREGVEKQLDTIVDQARANLKSSYAQKQFDEHSRIARQKWSEEIAAHADGALKIWGHGVNEERAKISQDGISAHPDDPQKLSQHSEALIEARVRQGQLKWGNDPGMLEMVKREAAKEGLKYRVEAIGVTDPARAMSILEKDRDLAGTLYEQLAGRFRGAATKANGQTWGDVILGRRSDLTYADQRFKLPEGTIGGIMQIESGMNPNAASKVSPSHRGLVGANDAWNKQWGVTDPTDVTQNATALGREATANRPQLTNLLGRDPTASEYWLAHNQGLGGALAQLQHPGEPAWKNMVATAEGRSRGEGWAKDAIWNQLTKAQKGFYKSVENVKGSDLVTNLQVTFQRAGQQVPFVDKETAYKRLDTTLVHNTPLYHATKSYIDQEISYQETANATRRLELERDQKGILKANEDGLHVDYPPDIGIVGSKLEAYQEQLAHARALGDAKRKIQYTTPEEDHALLLSLTSGMGMTAEQIKLHRHAPTTGPGTEEIPADSPDWLRQQAQIGDMVHHAVLTEGGDDESLPAGTAALYERRQHDVEVIQAALKKKQDALVGKDADPAAYLTHHRDMAPLLETLGSALASKDPARIVPAWEAYAEKQAALQTVLGIPSAQQHVMTKGKALEAVDQIRNSPDPQRDFDQLKGLYGKAWPHVYKDLVTLGGLPERRQATVLFPEDLEGARYASLLGKWEKEKPKDKEVKDLLSGGHKTVQAIHDNIDADPAVQSLLYSLQSHSSPAQIEGVKESIRELAYAMVYYREAPASRGWLDTRVIPGVVFGAIDKPNDAAQKAADAFTRQFVFDALPGGVRVLATDAEAVQNASKRIFSAPDIYDRLETPVITSLYRRRPAEGYGAQLLERAGQVVSGLAHGTLQNPLNYEPKAPLSGAEAEAERRAHEAVFENYKQADKKLKLTEQEKGLYNRHLENLWSRGGVDNADGSRSTIRQMTAEIDGRTYNIPTVWNGKILSGDAAMERAKAEGLDKFPSYASQRDAEFAYDQLHDFMERDTKTYLASRSDQRHGIPERREYVDMLKANHSWINNQNGDGLTLLDWQRRRVRDREGNLIEIKFKDARTLPPLPDPAGLRGGGYLPIS